MNYLDLCIGIPLIWGIYKGFTKGLIIEIATLIALILGVYGGIHFSYYAQNILKTYLDLGDHILPFASFIATFLTIVITINILAKILEKIIDLIALTLVNKIGGAFFGLLKAALIISLLLVIVDAVDKTLNLIPKNTKETSILYSPLKVVAPAIFPYLKGLNLQEQAEEVIVEV